MMESGADLFDILLLLRSLCAVALIGAFVLVHFEHGVPLRRTPLALTFYFMVALIDQILFHIDWLWLDEWWVAIFLTMAMVILGVSLLLDLRELYQKNGHAPKPPRG